MVKSTLETIGERKAIRLIRSILEPSSDVGKGDDCAILEFGEDYLLLTTDVVVEGKHFPEGTDGPKVGWLVVAVNLSDIAAMGGRPLGVVVSTTFRKNTDTEYLEGVMRGLKACANRFDTEVVGGDTKESDTIALSGCALGIVAKNNVMLRKGAKPDDLLVVTGSLGLAAAGYHSIKGSARRSSEKGITALLEPEPLVKEGVFLSKTGKVTACMDLSDSLASSVHQLSEVNNVGFEVEYEKLPISGEVHKAGIDPKEASLYFGGDYQLLLTIKKDAVPELRNDLKKVGTELTIIGRVTKGSEKTLMVDDEKQELENKSYEHFG